MTLFYLKRDKLPTNLYILYKNKQDSKFLPKNSNFENLKEFLDHNFELYSSFLEEINKVKMIGGKKFHNLQEIEVYCSNLVKGTSVITTYHETNQLMYKLDGIAVQMRPDHIMDGNTSFYDYYLTKYGKQVNLKQPLLKILKGCSYVYLIPELVKRIHEDYHKARDIYFSVQDLFQHKMDLLEFQKKIDCKFNNPELLRMAFTLKNYKNTGMFHYQRLEFLGDALLDLFVVEWEFHTLKQAREGPMTKFKHLITCNDTLRIISKELDLEKLMRGQSLFEKAYSDVVEAIIAAIYLDQGMEKAKEFVKKYCLKNAIECAKNSKFLYSHQTFENRNGVIDPQHLEKMKLFEEFIGKKFKNPYLLREALTPKSSSYKYTLISNNERLEFLGDTILKFIIVNYLYFNMPDADEG